MEFQTPPSLFLRSRHLTGCQARLQMVEGYGVHAPLEYGAHPSSGWACVSCPTCATGVTGVLSGWDRTGKSRPVPKHTPAQRTRRRLLLSTLLPCARTHVNRLTCACGFARGALVEVVHARPASHVAGAGLALPRPQTNGNATRVCFGALTRVDTSHACGGACGVYGGCGESRVRGLRTILEQYTAISERPPTCGRAETLVNMARVTLVPPGGGAGVVAHVHAPFRRNNQATRFSLPAGACGLLRVLLLRLSVPFGAGHLLGRTQAVSVCPSWAAALVWADSARCALGSARGCTSSPSLASHVTCVALQRTKACICTEWGTFGVLLRVAAGACPT